MKSIRSLTMKLTLVVLAGLALTARTARAELTLFDRDGWSFYTTGLVAAHYQLVKGDADPLAPVTLVGGQIQDQNSASDARTHKLTLSNIRSGFIGTQIGFGVNRQISQNVRVTSFLSINVAGINSNRGQETAKSSDYREAWAAVEGPFGVVKFGRMFGMFGEGSAEVMLMAFKYGVGHPCVVSAATISCGSSGAGPIYAGFDAAIRYISPRLAGFQLAVSVVDPAIGQALAMSPYPRVDSELNYDGAFGPLRLRLIGQTMFDHIESSQPSALTATGDLKQETIWGAMGTGIASFGGLTVGGGGWTGMGIGERIPLEAPDPAHPLFYDATLELRQFRGFYGNVQYVLGDTGLTLGGGELFIRLTDDDVKPGYSQTKFVMTDQYEYHATLFHKIDSLVLEAEFMHWHTDWQEPETLAVGESNPNQQSINFFGAGINYLW